MNEEQQMTSYYAESLSVVSKALLKNNVTGKKHFILKVIKELNDNINIPILNEKTEAKIFESIWEAVESILKKVILK